MLFSGFTPFLLIVLILWVCFRLLQFHFRNYQRCKCNVCLVGKTALVTGGNAGIGYQIALALAGRGCRVIIADRDNCDRTKEEIIRVTGNSNIVTKHFDLASFASVRKLVKDINENEQRLDILINNAGVGGEENVRTEDGHCLVMQVNHLGPFLLTHLLVELLKKSAPSRIIFTSSLLAFTSNLNVKKLSLNYSKNSISKKWENFIVYSNSKLCSLITTNGLAKKLDGTGVTVNALHPGFVHTSIFGKMEIVQPFLLNYVLKPIVNSFAQSPEEGAQTAIHLALSQEGAKITGKFYGSCRIRTQPSKANDRILVKKVWEESEKCTKLLSEEML